MSLFGSRISGFFGGTTSGGGGGGTFNPTTDYIPYNQGGSWGDSWWYNSSVFTYTTDVLSGTRQAYGFLHSPLTYEQSIGDFNNLIKGDYITIDNGSEFIKTFMSNTPYGLFIDRSFNTWLGDYSGSQFSYLKLDKVNREFELLGNGFGIKYSSANIDIGDPINFTDVTLRVGLSYGIATYYQGLEEGINWGASQNVRIGDYLNTYTGTYLEVNYNSLSNYIKTFISDNEFGLFVDGTQISAYLGDWQGIQNRTHIKVDDSGQVIYTSNASNDTGMNLDFANGIYSFGDTSGGNYLEATTSTKTIQTKLNGSILGMFLSESQGLYLLGDFDSNANLTNFGVDDSNQTLYASSNLQVTPPSPPTITSTFIPINIGGALRYIPIYS